MTATWKKQGPETTGEVVAEVSRVKSVKLVIEYRCDIEHLNVEELLEGMREQGYAAIVSVEGSSEKI